MKPLWNQLGQSLFSELQGGEEASLNLEAESSLYFRLNGNRVRQNTSLEQSWVSLQYQREGRGVNLSWILKGDLEKDRQEALAWLNKARAQTQALPPDPHLVAMAHHGSSQTEFTGELLPLDKVVEALASPAEGADLAGFYCGGRQIAAQQNSLGQDHWFSTESFFMDYSLYHGSKAAKSLYAGRSWSAAEWEGNLDRTKAQLKNLEKPSMKLKPGAYRVYLAPGAVNEVLGLLSWGALSAAAWKQGWCPFKKLAEGEQSLSPLFHLRENFALGLDAKFNAQGEISPDSLELISEGRLKSFLVNSRSAKEYGLAANGANGQETLRSPEIRPGSLQREQILKELDRGLWISNLHYMNWSDRTLARATGMTRYACFWVEKGEIVAPIQDLRFDESLYEAFGSKLRAVTDFSETEPSIGTYGTRSRGGARVPGMIIDDWTFTL